MARVVCDPAILGGKPVVEGTRVSVQQILGYLGKGASFDEILDWHPHLRREHIQAAVEYAAEAMKEPMVPRRT